MPLGILAKSPMPVALLRGGEGAVVGRDHLQRAGLQPGPQRILVLLVAERRAHHAARGIVPVGVLVLALVERQVLDQRLAIDAHALLPGAADRLVRLLAGDVDDIERHAGHVGDHDGAVGGLALDFGRARIGVAPRGRCCPRPSSFCGHRGDDVAVLGMDQRQGAELGAALERREHLVVVDHQGALVGHEVLEDGDAAVDDLGHLVPDLLAPPGDGHVEGVVAAAPWRSCCPTSAALRAATASGSGRQKSTTMVVPPDERGAGAATRSRRSSRCP